ncbi:ester cyclase [Peptacetobacter sp.]|uniref:ester cyclase n=1 Tax=Peptacetobacter sp. TaxID=2991975 RepID=UPI00262AE78D|nr:ester cyclase [Peptacetobacter sp.]
MENKDNKNNINENKNERNNKDIIKIKNNESREVKKMETKKEAVLNNNNKVFYGKGAEVVPVGVKDYNDFSKETKREQKMVGFDPQYRDFVDYIMTITHQIWEEKGIGVIYDTYHNNVTMHLGTSSLVGIKDVVANTLATLHAFPDRRLIGQNVIWSNFGAEGYLSSHRVMSTATNLGDSNFGPATGRKINFRTVIDCATTANRIHEEWLVRDNLWIVTQLGFDPHELAKNMAKASKSKTNPLQSNYGICESMEGQFMPEKYTAKDDSVGEMMLEMCSRVYNAKYICDVKKYYHENAVIHYICDKDLNGYDEIQGMIISFLSSIPSGSYDVERVTCTDRANNDGYDVSIRWRLRGINDGIGFLGQPSGKPINIMGINHYHVKDGKIIEEWDTFDGLDALKQKYVGLEEE